MSRRKDHKLSSLVPQRQPQQLQWHLDTVTCCPCSERAGIQPAACLALIHSGSLVDSLSYMGRTRIRRSIPLPTGVSSQRAACSFPSLLGCESGSNAQAISVDAELSLAAGGSASRSYTCPLISVSTHPPRTRPCLLAIDSSDTASVQLAGGSQRPAPSANASSRWRIGLFFEPPRGRPISASPTVCFGD
ncbi:hypothetical protein SAMN05660916_02953 [Arthrobacter sp. 31Cvi3.1E]|nr:hypothetical protein SAMN05660916_02953 [Arthrobacter sp. 31Cvi3.1E]